MEDKFSWMHKVQKWLWQDFLQIIFPIFFNELEALKLLESALPAWLYTYNSLNTSDQDRISPYNIDTISSRQVMRIKKKNQLGGLQGDPVPNSPN